MTTRSPSKSRTFGNRFNKDVPIRLRDLLDIATYVFAADQATVRGGNDVETFGSNWRRHFRFVVPVGDLDFWQSDDTKQCLTKVLNFLSDDHYEFEFVRLNGTAIASKGWCNDGVGPCPREG
jgi:hypothetical protein